MFIIISLQRIVFSFNRDSFFKSIFVWYFIKIAILTFSSNLGTFQHHFLAVSTLVRHIRIVLRYCYNITVQWRAWPLAVTKQKMSKVIGKVVRSNQVLFKVHTELSCGPKVIQKVLPDIKMVNICRIELSYHINRYSWNKELRQCNIRRWAISGNVVVSYTMGVNILMQHLSIHIQVHVQFQIYMLHPINTWLKMKFAMGLFKNYVRQVGGNVLQSP